MVMLTEERLSTNIVDIMNSSPNERGNYGLCVATSTVRENNLPSPVETWAVLYLPEAVLAVLHDPQSVVGPLAFAVELNVPRQSFQLYLSPTDTHRHKC